ncbi:hypothetical protein QZH41_015789 [Actinostola sp. cb2023]|nr:hypothetical protein QZH41_015789 [Actinostola sp. cb2023]
MSDDSSCSIIMTFEFFQLADLHIFVVPLELWLDKYRTAFNNIALESVSAGFVRVHPGLSLHHLRESLEEQLGEEVIPEEFIFLRSVGRCMAVVKENQEYLLKASDFLPPIAYSPEIFIIPGSHDTYARPASDSNHVVIATHGYTTAGMSSTNPFHLPMITQQNLIAQPQYINQQDYHGNPQRQDEVYQRGVHGNMPAVDGEMDYDNNKIKQQTQRDSFDDGNINGSFEENESGKHDGSYHNGNSRRMNRESQDADLTPRGQRKLSTGSKGNKNKNQNDKMDNQLGRTSPPIIKTVKIIEPEVVHSMPYQGPDGYLIAPPTPIPSGRVIASPVPGPRKSKGERTDNATKESKKKSKTKTKHKARSRSPSLERQQKIKITEEIEKVEVVPLEEYVIPSFEDIDERSKYAQFPSPAKSTRSHHPLYENEMDSGIADDLATPPYGLLIIGHHKDAWKSSWVSLQRFSSHNVFDAKWQRPIRSTISQTGIDGKSNGRVNIKMNEFILFLRDKRAGYSERDLRTDIFIQAGNKANYVSNEGKKGAPKKLLKKTGKKTVKKTAEDLDEKLKKFESVEPNEIVVPDKLRKKGPKMKELTWRIEEGWKAKVRRSKSLQISDSAETKSEHMEEESVFDEKRKTVPLEEQLIADFDLITLQRTLQHKVYQFVLNFPNGDGNKGGQEQDKTPSEKTNQLMLLARLQNEVENLKHKIEEIKMRLASEMKLRDNAQNELKQLREDLLDKKINLTLTKSQKSLVVLNNPENITA